jgi:Phage terminase large subunit (GpA)
MRKGDTGYDLHRERMAEISAEKSAKGREIGPLPDVVDLGRRARGAESLIEFCRIYFGPRFPWGFSDDQIEVAKRMENCIRGGAMFSLAMPRGGGKTTMAEVAAIWSLVYGYRKFVLLIQATEPLSARSLKKIQREFESNDLLLEDFPESCYPIRKLERITQRVKGQTLNGEPTMIEWRGDGIVLPRVPGAPSSGSIILTLGLTGALRGLSASGPDGGIIRPDLVIMDDCQTRESSKSPTQTAEREAIIMDDILGLAGPGQSIAAFNLCTVIYPNDLSDRFLNLEKHPEWRGLRTKMLRSMPTDLDKWNEYWELRKIELLNGDTQHSPSNQYYESNRSILDAGAVASWEHRKKTNEVSAIQHAMNLYLQNRRGFFAEYQNEPEVDQDSVAKEIIGAEAIQRLSGLPRFEVRREASKLTAFIDCGGGRGRGLWYCVCDWDSSFGGSIIDYGTWPRQARAMFAADDMRPGLAELYPSLSAEQRLYRGLEELCNEVLGRVYYREVNREEMRIERCLIDAGWLGSTVYQFVRQTPFAGTIYPSKGIARSNTSAGVGKWRSRPGEIAGHHWRITQSETGKGRMAQFDPDIWKSFVCDRFATAMGGAGSLRLFGSKSSAHEMIAEHLSAEFAEPRKTLGGDVFDKWGMKPTYSDNHLLDCLVGCAVGANIQGVQFAAHRVEAPTEPERPKDKPKKKKWSEIYAAKHGRNNQGAQ